MPLAALVDSHEIAFGVDARYTPSTYTFANEVPARIRREIGTVPLTTLSLEGAAIFTW
jgi:hypothetical protein